MMLIQCVCISFNSQPPEGGWYRPQAGKQDALRFNSQPPEGGWL